LSSSSGAPTGLSEVRWTRTTVGGPNYLGGSVTLTVGLPSFAGGTHPTPCQTLEARDRLGHQ
jgi:hypothetical protein